MSETKDTKKLGWTRTRALIAYGVAAFAGLLAAATWWVAGRTWAIDGFAEPTQVRDADGYIITVQGEVPLSALTVLDGGVLDPFQEPMVLLGWPMANLAVILLAGLSVLALVLRNSWFLAPAPIVVAIMSRELPRLTAQFGEVGALLEPYGHHQSLSTLAALTAFATAGFVLWVNRQQRALDGTDLAVIRFKDHLTGMLGGAMGKFAAALSESQQKTKA